MPTRPPKRSTAPATPTVPPERLRWRCDPAVFGFKTTDEIGDKPISIIGQPRALASLRLGLRVRADGYNIFVTGEVGTGRSTAVRRQLEELERKDGAPADLVYVNAFRNPDEPALLSFPSGTGRRFAKAVQGLLDGLRKILPDVFDSDAYRAQRGAILDASQAAHKERAKEFEKRVEAEGFALVQVQIGPLVRPEPTPLVAGNPVGMDQLEQLVEQGQFSKREFEKHKAAHARLTTALETLRGDFRKLDIEFRERLVKLDHDLARPVIREAVAELRGTFKDAAGFLDEVEEDVIEHLDRFREREEPVPAGAERDKARAELRDRMLPYAVNVVVDNAETRGFPVIWETSPTYRNLFGTIDRVRDGGGEWRTDHTRIRAGSLARASGGILVLDAIDVLVEPGVWPALKRTLRNRKLEIQAFDPFSLYAGGALKPAPIPLDVKVVMIGTRQIYRLLHALDEDFTKIFKVKADFALETPRSPDELENFARFVAKKCRDEALPPFHRDAVAEVVEHGVRLAGRQERLTTRFNEVADLVREAGFWAVQDKAKRVDARHVDRALDERKRRVDMVSELLLERLADGTVLMDLDGEKVGQVNGLVVLDVGDHVFGLPSRITAVTAMGRAGVVAIDRETSLSGPIHDKGLLILTGFLRERFAQDKPLSLTATLCFEQSYGEVEGDSASSTELYAMLSSLSGVPVRQAIAVTGSVNQRGEIQPVGGINEKIEGYFDLCRMKGLTGEQGVVIPSLNVSSLMLRKDVLDAARAGRFRIWAAATIEEGIEILTGFPAGARSASGTYPPDSVFGRVDARLRALAEGIAAFGVADLDLGG